MVGSGSDVETRRDEATLVLYECSQRRCSRETCWPAIVWMSMGRCGWLWQEKMSQPVLVQDEPVLMLLKRLSQLIRVFLLRTELL